MSDAGGAARSAPPSAAPDSCPPRDIEDAVQLANRVLEHHLGSRARQLTHETSGASNLVFTADHDRGEFVVRLCPDPERLRAYEKERWVIQRARAVGVPGPEVIDVGEHIISSPYMLMHRVAGRDATTHPRRLDILRALGAHAARINEIATAGFGDVFDWAPPDVPRHTTWNAFLADELQLQDKLETLARHEMLPAERLDDIRETLEALGDEPRAPRLNHGDLRLKNVIVDEEGEILAILDWEKCISGLAPEWELSLALHDLSVDEKEEFALGYELSPQELERHAPVLKALNVVNYAPFVQQAADANDEQQLDRFRLRLGKSLDLY